MAERNNFALEREMKIKIFWQDFYGEKFRNNNDLCFSHRIAS